MCAFAKFLGIIFPAPSPAVRQYERQLDRAMAPVKDQPGTDKDRLQQLRDQLIEVSTANNALYEGPPTPESETREAEIMIANIKLVNTAATKRYCRDPCQICLDEHTRHPQPRWKRRGCCAECKDAIRSTAFKVLKSTSGSLTRSSGFKAAWTRHARLMADLDEVPDVEVGRGLCRRCEVGRRGMEGFGGAQKVPYCRVTVTDVAGKTEKVSA